MAETSLLKMGASEIVTKCNNLRSNWSPRHGQMKEWYERLMLKNILEQEGMESYISNEPRTFYNMALHFLCPQRIPHRIPIEGMEPSMIEACSAAEALIETGWAKNANKSRARGRYPFIREIGSFMLATGWYAAFAMADNKELVAEAWNPANVFPEFGDDGLVQVAHIYDISADAAKRKATLKGWKADVIPESGEITVYNYWGYDGKKVVNTVIMNNQFIRPLTSEAKLTTIPIFTGPVGGLPDRGSIITGNDYIKHMGESILATNDGVYKNFDRLITFTMQLLRDTAQPRWYEKSTGGNILKEEDMFKRGAIFRGGLQDEVGTLPMPPLPVELRTISFDMQSQLQKGSFSSLLAGNITGQVTGYLMSQIAEQSKQVLRPYHDILQGLLSDIDNLWLGLVTKHGYKPYGIELPKLPEDASFNVEYPVNVPGDIVQRATVARMLNPDFTISTTMDMDLMFPEIKNPLREQARADKDRAMQHPVAITISLIAAWRSQADDLRKEGRAEEAELFEKAAKAAEASLTTGEQQIPQTPAGPQHSRPEAGGYIPPELRY